MKDILLVILLGYSVSMTIINIKFNSKKKYEYQLTISNEGTTIYDDSRIVGFLPYSCSSLDTLLINDNQ